MSLNDENMRLRIRLRHAVNLLRELERTLQMMMKDDDSEERREVRSLIKEYDESKYAR